MATQQFRFPIEIILSAAFGLNHKLNDTLPVFYFVFEYLTLLRIFFCLHIHELWGREWQSPPVFLPGEFHGQRNLVGYSLWVCKRVGHV